MKNEEKKIVEEIEKILEKNNKLDKYITAREIYKEVVEKALDNEKSLWQNFGWAHRGFGRHGH